MVSCALRSCTNRSNVDKKKSYGVTYHRFPNEKCLVRRQKWTTFVGRIGWKPSKYSVLCSKHFEEKFFDRTSSYIVRLRDNAVPTIGSSANITASENTPSVISSTHSESDSVASTAASRCMAETTEIVMPRKLKMKRKLERSIEVSRDRKRKLDLLRKKLFRQRKKILSLESIISNLKKNNLLPEESLKSLEMISRGEGKHCASCVKTGHYRNHIQVS